MRIWRKTSIRKFIDVPSRPVLINRRQRHYRRALIPAIIIAWGLLGIMAGAAQAEDGDDKLGNWLGVNSTVRFSDHWSLFGQGEVRFWEAASDLNETLFRIAGHYDINKIAMVGLGYVRVDTWPYDDGGDRVREENRLYQQFAMKQAWARARFEHRFRLEQRWFPKNDGDSYSNRGRYRLQVTIPLNHATMQPGTYFINTFNETFINFDDGDRDFDQNRLYVAGGHQFTPGSNLQLGLLWQARSSEDFFRLQFYYTHNFDLRKR
jgi:hypothetical protein